MAPRLVRDEEMVLPLMRQSWTVPLRTAAIGATALGIGLLLVSSGGIRVLGQGDRVALWTWVGATALLGVQRYLGWRRNSVTITDRRILLEGERGGRARVVPLATITDVEAWQSPLDRLLDEGTVRIGLQGGRSIVVTHLPHPVLVRDQIFVLADQVHRGT